MKEKRCSVLELLATTNPLEREWSFEEQSNGDRSVSYEDVEKLQQQIVERDASIMELEKVGYQMHRLK